MRALIGFIFQIIFLSFASASVFLTSNVFYPIPSQQERIPVQMPTMRLSFDEFSPAFAALEDDYYVANYEEEKIPQNVRSQVLKTTDDELIKSQRPQLQIPQMTMRADGTEAEQAALFTTSALQNPQKTQKTTVDELLASQKKNIGLNPTHFWIQGKIELTGGLAISDPRDSLFIGWFVRGENKKEGKILLREGTYEIKVDRLEGEVIAELADKNGYLLGEAIIDLDVLAQERASPGFVIAGVDIQLKPYNFSLSGQTLSVYSSSQQTQVVSQATVAVGDHDMNFRSSEKGQFSEPLVSPHSIAILSAEKEKYRETRRLADFERNVNLHLFPEPFLQAFFETINLPKAQRGDGIIWGSVYGKTQPLANYQVRIAEHPEARPIYFEMYIAAKNREKTSDDGQFSFVAMNDGVYELELVNDLGQVVDSQWLSVREGSVTEVRFDLGESRPIQIRPFDPLSMEPQPIQFFTNGMKSVQQLKTEDVFVLKSFKGTDPLLVTTKLQGADLEAVTFASRQKKFQEIPVLNTKWWRNLQKQYQLTSQQGVIVGFVDTESPFDVFIDHQTEKTKVLYLDQQGQTIQKAYGVKPAGFVVFGIEKGIHTLVLESEQGQIASDAAYIDGESVAMIYKAL